MPPVNSDLSRPIGILVRSGSRHAVRALACCRCLAERSKWQSNTWRSGGSKHPYTKLTSLMQFHSGRVENRINTINCSTYITSSLLGTLLNHTPTDPSRIIHLLVGVIVEAPTEVATIFRHLLLIIQTDVNTTILCAKPLLPLVRPVPPAHSPNQKLSIQREATKI